MAIEFFKPIDYDADLEGCGIVLFNHAGSRVAQDTGRDARYMADAHGVPVVAVDRPGTAMWHKDEQLAEQLRTLVGYVGRIALLAPAINATLDSLQVQRSLIAGRSAGGLAALAMAESGAITTQKSVYAAEPVSSNQPTTVEEGRRWYSQYSRNQERHRRDNPLTILPEPAQLGLAAALSRLAYMGPDNLYDRYHNGQIWASDAALRYIQDIAINMPEVDINVDYAYLSMVTSPDIRHSLTDNLGHNFPNAHIEQVPNTTHASFDNRSLMARRMQPVLERMAA